MKLVIRADANPEIGSGHVMRCLSIAQAAQKKGAQCIFVTADKQPEPLLKSQGFRCICLESKWNALEGELDRLTAFLESEKPDVLLLDSYRVTRHYMGVLDKFCKLVYLDDVQAFLYPCHTLVNYNCYSEDMNYQKQYAGTGTRLLLGTRYVPLRAEFCGLAAPHIKEEVGNVLLSTGGSDGYGMGKWAVKELLVRTELESCVFHLVAGAFHKDAAQLEEMQKQLSWRVVLHQNVQEMARLMQYCDIAVSAGGSTLYELCACGVPTVVFTAADNQLPGACKLGRGPMVYAGDARDDVQACARRVGDAVTALAKNPLERKKHSDTMRQITDGCGAENLVMEW